MKEARFELNSGGKTIEVPLPQRDTALNVIEVKLEASRHFTGITDHRMKSFKLYQARLQ